MGLTDEEQAMLMRRQKEQLALRDQQSRYGPNGHPGGGGGGGGAMESSRFAAAGPAVSAGAAVAGESGR